MDVKTKPLTREQREARDAALIAHAFDNAYATAALPAEASVRKKKGSTVIHDAAVPEDTDTSPYKTGLRSRGWVFTWNNPVVPPGYTDFVDYYKAWEPQVSYLVVGNEHAPTTGTPHHQGAVWFKNQRTWSACRSTIKCFWAPAKGSGEQNFNYSNKESILIEYGERKQQGNRSDLEDVRNLIQTGGQMKEVTERASNLQAIKIGQLYLQHHPELHVRRNWEMEIYWIKGPSGAGKTRWCYEQAPMAHFSSRNLQWWDGYSDQEDVIVDDFRGDFCTYHELLRICDRYPYRVQVKGSSCELLAKRIFFTSCMLPTEVYNTREDIWQLLRRITAVYEFCSEDGSANVYKHVNKVDSTKVEQLGKLPPRTLELEVKSVPKVLPGFGASVPPTDVELIIKNQPASSQKSGGNKSRVGSNIILPSPASPDNLPKGMCPLCRDNYCNGRCGTVIFHCNGCGSAEEEHKCPAYDIECPHEHIFADDFGNETCEQCGAFLENDESVELIEDDGFNPL
nr:putative replication associated protein [Crucivirus sp.]